MDGVVVSLDPAMSSLEGVWVINEIGTAALRGIPVFFRQAAGLDQDSLDKLRTGQRVIKDVKKCKATSDADKDRILKSLEEQFQDIKLCNFLQLSWGSLKAVGAISPSFGAMSSSIA